MITYLFDMTPNGKASGFEPLWRLVWVFQHLSVSWNFPTHVKIKPRKVKTRNGGEQELPAGNSGSRDDSGMRRLPRRDTDWKTSSAAGASWEISAMRRFVAADKSTARRQTSVGIKFLCFSSSSSRGQFQVKWVKMMMIIIFTLIIIHPSIRYCHLHRLWGSLGSAMSTGISVLNNSEYLIRLLYLFFSFSQTFHHSSAGLDDWH